MNKLFSAACEKNAPSILQAITPLLVNCRHVLEIGSGTGQHAVYFSQHLPHLAWQTSDRLENHPSIKAYIDEASLSNIQYPFILDVAESSWPDQKFDALFTANTCHIMSWEEVELMFAGCANIAQEGAWFFIYGPFNYQGKFTSLSNQQFDASLKSQVPHRGIRDIEAMLKLAKQHHFILQEDKEMPANNRLLAFKKS
jgi:cyclopropane fatty-acyl-phospholipid synthase-like methyltransferase